MVKKSVNRLFRLLLMALLFPFIIPVVAWLILMHPVTQRRIITFAENQVERVLVGDCTIGSLSTNFFSYAEIRNIALRDNTGHGDSIVIDRVRAWFSVFSLINKKVTVREAVIDTLDAFLTVRPDGKLMIPALPDPAFVDSVTRSSREKEHKPPTDWVVYIGKARAMHVNAIYSDSMNNFVGKISDAVAAAEIYNYDSMRLHLAVPGGSYESPWWTGTVDTIGSSAVLTLKGITIDDIFVKGSTTNIRGGGHIPFSAAGYWDLSAAIQSDLAPISAIFGNIPTLTSEGDVEGIVSWRGTIDHPVLDFRASGSGWKSTLFSIPSLLTEATYDGDSLLNIRSVLVTNIGQAVCSSKVFMPSLFRNPSVNNYQAACHVNKIDLMKTGIPDSLHRYIPWRRGTMSIFATGNGIEHLPGTIQTHAILYSEDTTVKNMGIEGTFHEEHWKLSGSWMNNKVSGQGTIDLTGSLTGIVKGDLDDVAGISSLVLREHLDGNVEVHGTLHGTLSNPAISLEITSDELSWRSVTADSILTQIDISKDGIGLHPSFISLKARIDSVAAWFGIDGLKGSVVLDAMISGDIKAPDINVICSGNNIVYSQWTADSIDAVVNIANYDSIHVKKLNIIRGESGVRGSGDVSIRSRFIDFDIDQITHVGSSWKKNGHIRLKSTLQGDSINGSVSGNAIDIAAVNSWLPLNDSFAGVCNFYAELGGPIVNPEGFLEFSIEYPHFNDLSIQSVNGKVELKDSTVLSRVAVAIADSLNPVVFDVNVPVLYGKEFRIDKSGSRPANIAIKGHDLSAFRLIKILGGDWNSDGAVQCDIDMELQNSEWVLNGVLMFQSDLTSNNRERMQLANNYIHGSITGTIKKPHFDYFISTGEVLFSGGKIDSAIIKGTLETDTLKCDTMRLSFPYNGLLELSGILPLDKFDSLLLQTGIEADFSVVNFPLQLLTPFLPENMIQSGIAHGDGMIHIKNGRPVLSGTVYVDSIIMALEDVTPAIGPLGAIIRMSNDSLFLEQMSGVWGKGPLHGQGTVVWSTKGISDLSLNTRGTNLSFEMTDVLSVNIADLNVTVSKQEETFLVKGTIDVGPTRIIRDIRITDFIRDPGAKIYAKVEPDSSLDNINLQIKMNFLENPVVDMNLGYLLLGGDIIITGTAQTPSFIGNVIIDEGYVIYLDRQFEVTEGRFVNYDPQRLNPVINLKAQTEVFATSAGNENIENFIIYLDVSGTFENPIVTLSDESGDLNEVDIISILTLGQRLGSIGDDLGERLKVFAGQSILGFGTRKLEQVLKMDRIDFQGNIFSSTSKTSPTLTLSKRISPKLLVTYETAIRDLTRRKITALFRLTRRFFIKGNTESDDYGLDLIFKYSK